MNHLLVCINPVLNINAVKYVFRQFSIQQGFFVEFCYNPSKLSEVPCIFYGFDHSSQTTNQLVLPFSDFFLPDTFLKKRSLPVGKGKYDNYIPCFLFRSSCSCTPVADPVAHTFFLLTIYEDLVYAGNRDHRHRKMFGSSFLSSNHEFLKIPTVDIIFDHWIKLIKNKFPEFVNNKILLENKNFCFSISRDIDSLHSVENFNFFALIKSALKGKLIYYLRSIYNLYFLDKKDDHNNLKEIISWEKAYSLRSSINFLASEAQGDANYSLHEIFEKNKFLEEALEEGWECGFHPGTYAWQDHFEFRKQLNELQKYLPSIRGGRQHGLRFSNPHTWRLWEENELIYDSTIGFAEMEGFRAGTCFPYQVFDLLENNTLNLIEIPLTVMDCTLDKYRKLDLAMIEQTLKNLYNTTREFGGVFSILWHNTYFNNGKRKDYGSLLQKFIIEISSESLCLTHSQIADIWNQRIKKYNN